MTLKLARIYKCKAQPLQVFKTGKNIHIIKKLLNDCSRVFKNITTVTYITSGTYGEVFSVIGKKHGKTAKVIVKTIIIENDKEMDGVLDEFEIAYNMGNANIGPKIYDSFFIEMEKDNGPNKKMMVIVMEFFDTDVSDIIQTKISIQTKKKIIKQVINLIKKQIYKYNLYCVDIKLTNFVYNKKTNMVRMIDFDPYYCTNGLKDKLHKNNLVLKKCSSKELKEGFYAAMYIQLISGMMNFTNLSKKVVYELALTDRAILNKIYSGKLNSVLVEIIWIYRNTFFIYTFNTAAPKSKVDEKIKNALRTIIVDLKSKGA